MPRTSRIGDGDTVSPARSWTRPLSWPRAVAAVLVVLLGAEVGLRAIADHLPRPVAGDTVEIELKLDQLRALSADGEPVDLVVLGNSTLDAGVDPTVLAEASVRFDAPYNAALLGAPLAAIGRWASEFVLAEADPDMVVLGLTPLDVPTLGSFGVSKPAVAAAFDASFDRLRPDAFQRADRNLSRRSVLVERRSAFRSPGELWRGITDTVTGEDEEFEGDGPVTLEDGTQGVRDRQTWEKRLLAPRGGNRTYWGVEFDGTISARLSAAERRAFQTSNIDDLQLAGVVNAIRDAGVADLVVVIPPHDRQALGEAGVPLDDFDRLADQLASFARAEDMAVIDLSAASWPHADFFDPAHLSKGGASRFTRLLAAELDRL